VPSAESARIGDQPFGDADDLPRFRPTGEVTIHQGWIVTVTRAGFVGPDGVAFERDVVRHPGAVAMVAVTEVDTVVLVHQYRPALDRWLLEIPAGTCDVDGEPDQVTARRELAEEVGYAAAELTLLTRCAITPGFCDEYSTIYLATGLTKVPLDRHGTEERFMRIVEVPLTRFDGLVDDGAIIDATTILGVGLARRHLISRR
jgi:8-oxo-dGTP pyrophosphatase MutT (NUDIX family)